MMVCYVLSISRRRHCISFALSFNFSLVLQLLMLELQGVALVLLLVFQVLSPFPHKQGY